MLAINVSFAIVIDARPCVCSFASGDSINEDLNVTIYCQHQLPLLLDGVTCKH